MLKDLAEELGVVPEGNKTMNATWIEALLPYIEVGEPSTPRGGHDDDTSSPTAAQRTTKLSTRTPSKPGPVNTTLPAKHEGKTWAELARDSGLPTEGRLLRPVNSDDELMTAMRADEKKNPAKEGCCGVRLPMYYPLVTASFAARNLSGDKGNGIAADDGLAGRDPWSICDYLRDALQWPAALIFVDAEQTGMYDLDHYDAQRGVHAGSRNWKKAFTWAQTHCHVMLFFMSNYFFESANCIQEFKDYCSLLADGEVTAVPVIALLDEGLKSRAHSLMAEMRDNAHSMPIENSRRTFKKANVFDLSSFMAWKHAYDHGIGGEKMSLREASEQMQELRDQVELLAGGRLDNAGVYYGDMLHGWQCQDLRDDNLEPVRNRYKHDVRRVNINRVSAEELTERLPNVGPTKAAKIVAYRRRVGGLRHADDLLSIEGVGDKTVEGLLPFVTFGDVMRQGGVVERWTSQEDLEEMKMGELKDLAAELGVVPEGNKTMKATWIEALMAK